MIDKLYELETFCQGLREYITAKELEISKLKKAAQEYEDSWNALTNDLIKMHRRIYDGKMPNDKA